MGGPFAPAGDVSGRRDPKSTYLSERNDMIECAFLANPGEMSTLAWVLAAAYSARAEEILSR